MMNVIITRKAQVIKIWRNNHKFSIPHSVPETESHVIISWIPNPESQLMFL